MGFTQQQLADAAGLTRPSIVNIERGRQKVMLHSLYSMAAALRVPVSDLLPPIGEASVEEQLRSDPIAQQDPSILRFWEEARTRHDRSGS